MSLNSRCQEPAPYVEDSKVFYWSFYLRNSHSTLGRNLDHKVFSSVHVIKVWFSKGNLVDHHFFLKNINLVLKRTLLKVDFNTRYLEIFVQYSECLYIGIKVFLFPYSLFILSSWHLPVSKNVLCIYVCTCSLSVPH